jgi:hypothetical protein
MKNILHSVNARLTPVTGPSYKRFFFSIEFPNYCNFTKINYNHLIHNNLQSRLSIHIPLLKIHLLFFSGIMDSVFPHIKPLQKITPNLIMNQNLSNYC